MFSLLCVNNRDAGDLRRRRPHYDVTVMVSDVNVMVGRRYIGR